MANPFYGGANIGMRGPVVPPIGSQSIGMNMGGSFFPPAQPIMQPPMNTMQQNLQNVQSMIPQSNIIWIDDVNQIAGFPTGRGWQQWFGLKNEQVMYVRETDMNGVTQPIRKVRYEPDVMESEPNRQAQPQQQTQESAPAPPPPPANAVTREEFQELAGSVKTLTEKLTELLS